jgi:hypothetical protein
MFSAHAIDNIPDLQSTGKTIPIVLFLESHQNITLVLVVFVDSSFIQGSQKKKKKKTFMKTSLLWGGRMYLVLEHVTHQL